jgi:S-adenosylmethionine:tRNA ribosyltransferase-isomerase
MHLEECDYELPSELIAQQPVRVRDHARLLIMNRVQGTVMHARVRDLPHLLGPNDLLVINDTKVFPARLLGRRRDTGGKVEIVLVRQEGECCWQALVKPSHRLAVGAEITFDGSDWRAEIGGHGDMGMRWVALHGPGPLRTWLSQHGHVPLPPYIKRDGGETPMPVAEHQDRRRYQTVYAKHLGSVAAPTAGLHFSRALLRRLRDQAIEVHTVTLHVGPGTFRPVRSTTVEAHAMDAERYSLSPGIAAALNAAKAAGKRIIAVGTTSTRTLESAADAGGRLRHLEGATNLFIYPGYRFKIVDAVLTNFHLPRSTPLLLVMALAGRETVLAAYREAIARRYRFYSYGDAMLIV